MKIRFVRPTLYVDTNIWFVYEHPTSLDVVLVKIPIDISCVRSLINNPIEIFTKTLTEKFGPVELEDLGDWENIISSTGETTHPFTKQVINAQKLREL